MSRVRSSHDSRPSSAELLDAALAYAARGWSIIPIRHRSGGDKKPACRAWKPFQIARPTETELRSMFHSQDLDGLAVILGPVSGHLCCRDFDAAEAYPAWAASHADLAKCLPTVRTKRGYHVYFRCPGLHTKALRDGEMRAALVYVLLPPSAHVTGVRYEWIVPLGEEIATIDPSKAGLLTERPETPESPESPEEDREWHRPSLVSPVSLPSLSVNSDLPHKVAEAIRDTLPRGAGERNDQVFRYLRCLKGMPEYATVSVYHIQPLVRAWHRQALPIVGTKDWDATWADAVHAWPKIRHPKGTGTMQEVTEAAKMATPPKCAARYETQRTKLLVSICRELQHRAGSEPFRLDHRTAGEAIGVDRTSVGRLLEMLVVDGIVRVVERGKPGKATRWLYLGDALPSLAT